MKSRTSYPNWILTAAGAAGHQTMLYPTKELGAHERWDLIAGRLLQAGDRACGTVRYIALADDRGECYECSQPIIPGQLVDEDFIRVHARCADRFDPNVPPITMFQNGSRFLSNFWPCYGVTVAGELYPSVEHAYQASKCFYPADRERIRTCATPGIAKQYGGIIKRLDNWDDIRLSVMLSLLRTKFSDANPDLWRRLMDTGEAQLIEGNYWHDTFWGVCRGEGQNHLGRLLMKVRDELRIEGMD